MRKLFFSFLLLGSVFLNFLEAVEKNVVKTNPLLHVMGAFNLQYERALTDRFTVGGGFWNMRVEEDDDIDIRETVQSYGMMVRYYPKAAHDGWFFGFGVSRLDINLDWEIIGVDDEKISRNSMDFEVGYVKSFDSNLTLSFSYGLMISPSDTYTQDFVIVSGSGSIIGEGRKEYTPVPVIPIIGINVGYRF